MKKTHFIDLLRNIKTNLISFTAIIIFVSLGVALFCGLAWIKYSTNGYVDGIYHDGSVHTVELAFPLGISQEDIEKLQDLSAVNAAEGIRSVYGTFVLNDTEYQANIRQLTHMVDTPLFVEGTLPAQMNEIAVEASWASETGIQIGDTITFGEIFDSGLSEISVLRSFSTENIGAQMNTEYGNKPTCLLTNSFTVTALMENAAYFESASSFSYGVSQANKMPINCILFVGEEAFNTDAIANYTGVVLNGKETKELYAFSQEFLDAEKRLSEAAEEKARQIASEQFRLLTEKAEQIKAQTGISLLELEKEPDIVMTLCSQLATYNLCTSMNRVQKNSSLTLASLFVIVAMLVCYSALSRIISDQTVQIGTKKALGMKEREIRLFYFGFSAMALLIGVSVGALLGMLIVEPVLLTTIKTGFTVSDFSLCFSLKELLTILAVEAGFILFSTWLAVNKQLKRSTVSLLSGSTERVTQNGFYEKSAVYKRLSLLSQIIVNNFFKDRKRVLGTVIGIFGCTSLVVVAFTYQSVIADSFTKQYDRFFHFDTMVYFDSRDTTAVEKIGNVLKRENVDHTAMLSETLYLKNNDGQLSPAKLFVPTNLSDYQALVTPVSAEHDNQDVYKGLWISQAYQKEYGLHSGDALECISFDGKRANVHVDGFVKHYLIDIQCYMDQDSYYNYFGSQVVANAFIINLEKYDKNELDRILSETGVRYKTEYYKEQTYFTFGQIGNLANTVAFVYLILAVAMSVLVLLNLLYMFINEKKKEILILLIYGYSMKDAKRYIYSDTILLAVVGSVLGVIIGELLGNIAAMSYETRSVIFDYAFKWQAAMIGIVISAALTFMMSYISLKKIDKFKLLEINQ